jgi:tetratricopeptide (TPR) repeat protein
VVLGFVTLLLMQPDPAMLRQLYEEELKRKTLEYGASDIRTVQAARDLGLFLSKHDQPAAAEKVFSEVVRRDVAAFGAGGKQTLADLASLAAVSPQLRAEPLWRQASASADSEVAARAFAALGQLRESAGDPTGAAGFYRQALAKLEQAARETAPNPDRARVAARLSAIAQVLGQIVDPPEGIAVLRRALDLTRAVLGMRHPETATLQANLAGVLLDANAVDESVRLLAEALPILEETLGEDHPRVAISASILAHGLQAKGDYAGAERNFRRAVSVDERAYGPKQAQTLNDLRALADFLRETGKVQEAVALEKRLATGAK